MYSELKLDRQIVYFGDRSYDAPGLKIRNSIYGQRSQLGTCCFVVEMAVILVAIKL
jgi:hypothetical protein